MLAHATINIESLIETELPPLPGSASRVANLAQDLNSSARALADAIGIDPALTTRILRVANSPLYAVERAVTSLPSAVNTLGNNTIHMFVMFYVAADAFNRRDGKSLPAESVIWQHSVAVAIAARELSHTLGMRGGEEMFLCGLLHDIGKLLLLRHSPELYASVTNDAHPLAREQELYGYTHAQIGAFAARRWGLPDEIAYAIHHHHDPNESANGGVMARVIDVANMLVNNVGVGLSLEEAHADLALSDSVIALRVTAEQLEAAWQKTNAQWHEVQRLFT